MVWMNVGVLAVPSLILLVLFVKTKPLNGHGHVSRQWVAQHSIDD